MRRGKRKLNEIAIIRKTCTAKLRKCSLGGCVWYPGRSYDIYGKILRCCSESVGNASAHTILYHTEDDRMCDHHNRRFKAEFLSSISRILASHSICDPHTVTNMIHYRVLFLIGSQSTRGIERDRCFLRKE